MPAVTVVVPWRTDGGQRADGWKWLRRRWEALLPGATIVEVDSAAGSFSTAEAVNRGVLRADHGIVVVAWADAAVEQEWLSQAFYRLAANTCAAIAPRVCCRVGRWETEDLLRCDPDAPMPDPHGPAVVERRPGGWVGVAVTTRRALDEVPFDERFDGRDYEGDAWLAAVAATVAPVDTFGEAYHLWHDERDLWRMHGAPERAALFNLYSKAANDPEAMHRVLADLRA